MSMTDIVDEAIAAADLKTEALRMASIDPEYQPTRDDFRWLLARLTYVQRERDQSDVRAVRAVSEAYAALTELDGAKALIEKIKGHLLSIPVEEATGLLAVILADDEDEEVES